MSQDEQFQQIAREAADPNVDPNRLRQIAAEYPGLHAIIAQNPVAYEGLLDWLEAQGNPDVVAAIALRRSNGRSQTPPAEAASSAPVAYQTASPAAAEKKNTRLVITFIVLALLAIVLVVGAVAMATGMFNGLFSNASKPATAPKVVASVEDTVKQTAESGSSSEKKTAPNSEPTKEPTPEHQVKYPEPSGSQAMPAFSSPSQNIFCGIKDDEAFCAISTRDYAKEGPDACFGIFGMKITGKGQAVTTCNDPAVDSLPDSAPVLEYGSSATNGAYACTMSKSGVTCWNKFSGTQFSIRRAAFQVEQR